MKITLKSLICMSLTVLLLISTVACASPVEPATGSDTTAGTTEEQTTEEITSEEITTESPQSETTNRGELFQDLLKDALRDYTVLGSSGEYHPSNIYYGLPGKSNRLTEIAPGVYMAPSDWKCVVNNVSDETLILFEVYIAPVIESYYWGIESVTGERYNLRSCELQPQLSEKEFYEAFETYRPILDANGIVYYLDSKGNPGTHYGYGDEYFQCFSCLMTPKQILDLEMPEGYYITIAYFNGWK